jgi:ABC-type lipopolysaccharide export system ATPase subunit
MRSLVISSYAYVLETGKIVAQGASSVLKDNDMVRRHYLGV